MPCLVVLFAGPSGGKPRTQLFNVHVPALRSHKGTSAVPPHRILSAAPLGLGDLQGYEILGLAGPPPGQT